MSDEYINILNEDLSILKSCLKSEAHRNGYFHASVHIWFYTDTGKVLLQKRSKNKIAFPNLWDVSVAGHINSKENETTASLREIQEEIGLKISENDLVKIGIFKELFQHQEDFIDNEVHHIYICKLQCDIDQLTLQNEEVIGVKLVDIKKIINLEKQPEFKNTYVPHNPEYYKLVMDKLVDLQ